MRRGPRRTSTRRTAVPLLLPLFVVLVSTCEPMVSEVPNRDRHAMTGGPIALAPSDTWRRVTLDLTRAVTPRFGPSGEHLMVRGTSGIGLFVFSREGELVLAEDLYRGDAVFTSEGSICRGPKEEARPVRLDGRNQWVEPPGARCTLVVEDERYGEQLHEGPSGAVYHDAYAGTVTRVSPDGAVTEVTSQGPWNVAVSPDGRRIAWARGDLAEPELSVYDVESGAVPLGRGAHPTWSASGRHLIFTRPYVTDGHGEWPSYDADLFVFDATTREVTRLTDTPGVAEMQPSLAPNGASLAFADWQSGDIYVSGIAGLEEDGGQR